MARTKAHWQFRVAPDTDDLVRRAAETADKTLTDFVVAAATMEAQRVLADRTTFTLSSGLRRPARAATTTLAGTREALLEA